MNKIKWLKTHVLVHSNQKIPSHFVLHIKKELKLSKKFFHSFIDLGLHFDLCENESYSTFVA